MGRSQESNADGFGPEIDTTVNGQRSPVAFSRSQAYFRLSALGSRFGFRMHTCSAKVVPITTTSLAKMFTTLGRLAGATIEGGWQRNSEEKRVYYLTRSRAYRRWLMCDVIA